MSEQREDEIAKLKSEKNILIVMSRVIISLVVVIISLVGLIISLFPLKEKDPYFVEFKTAKENYVVVRKANKELLSKDAVVQRELKGYVVARETINKIDEIRKWRDIVRLKSSPEVYAIFHKQSLAKEALWNTEGFSRECVVTNISEILKDIKSNQFISIVEYTIIDRYPNNNQPPSELNFKATIKYEFNDQKISLENLTLNPLGTHIIAYKISEIEEK